MLVYQRVLLKAMVTLGSCCLLLFVESPPFEAMAPGSMCDFDAEYLCA